MSDVTTTEPELKAEALELINTELADRMARQAAAGAQIDTKAVLLVGYAAAASSFLATQHPQPLLAGMAYAAYAVAAGLGIWAYAVGTYQDVPAPRRLFMDYATRPRPDALAALAATRVEVFEDNEPKHERKATRWKASLAALVIGITLMLASLLAHTGSHDRSTQQGQRPASAGVSGRALITACSWPQAAPTKEGGHISH